MSPLIDSLCAAHHCRILLTPTLMQPVFTHKADPLQTYVITPCAHSSSWSLSIRAACRNIFSFFAHGKSWIGSRLNVSRPRACSSSASPPSEGRRWMTPPSAASPPLHTSFERTRGTASRPRSPFKRWRRSTCPGGSFRAGALCSSRGVTGCGLPTRR